MSLVFVSAITFMSGLWLAYLLIQKWKRKQVNDQWNALVDKGKAVSSE